MSADTLLSHLDKVRPTGQGRWLAACPAHEDRTPSLSIRELPDGRLLLHCFAGCGVHEVLVAVGMTMVDLHPERLGDHLPRERRPFPCVDILRALCFETTVVLLAASSMIAGVPLAIADRERLELAAARIGEALRAGGVNAH